ncbi:hypothetical protein H7U19_04380 [Hyunsoonleella sp. SJ7]|uniref:Uncharacterized protein n=1 Tax=Hyunsoonleella aquatilis TaxID=2762758 RepID=A0A923KG60_9FLAO|nr:hypothetical protein [Hyunsoonleella aquatilis]MBC3757626.1 hypothetical protein [Hyunsoonleella aquatilis]
MKLFKTAICILIISLSFTINAQEVSKEKEESLDKTSYYEKRAKEDAKFEQEFKAETEAEAEEFWEEQEAYEKELKKRDRKAYRAYMKGKRDAYAEHYEYCNHHCHHGDHYYHHASFYYYRYDRYYYDRYPRPRNTVSTNVRANVPRVRVGIGL